jgi:L-lactate dehydrogenase complex protein LldG
MSAREEILSRIRIRRLHSAPTVPDFAPPALANPIEMFVARAQRANAELHFLDSEIDVPHTIAWLLRARNLPAIVHVPPHASALPWDTAPGLTLHRGAPGPDDAAVALAPFGIAETGTLVYASTAGAPASWHFRAGFEIAVVRADAILPHMENAIAVLKASGLPSTINFVTGPSRTGDIEQTLELGAHGPKALAILIVQN